MDKINFTHYSFVTNEINEFLNTTTFSEPNWKWLVFIAALVIGFFLVPVIRFIVNKIKMSHAFYRQQPRTFMGYIFLQPIQRPIAWILILLLLFFVGDTLHFSTKVETYLNNILRLFLTVQVIKLVYYAVDAGGQSLRDIAINKKTNYDNQLIPFATKCAKIAIVVLGTLLALQGFGFNVVSVLAGLGIGGLALALAAQDTAANLFGSITIFLDQPFKVGDWVKVKDIEGNIEDIGFRSTRVRTFYDSLITVPNSIMAKENIDNMGARHRRRVRQTIGLTYECGPEKVEEFCKLITALLLAQEKVHADSVSVAFNNFGQSSLDVVINFNLMVSTGPEENELKQKILLDILRIANNMGADIAYQTQMVYQKNL